MSMSASDRRLSLSVQGGCARQSFDTVQCPLGLAKKRTVRREANLRSGLVALGANQSALQLTVLS